MCKYKIDLWPPQLSPSFVINLDLRISFTIADDDI